MDDAKHGRALQRAYLDYLSNLSRRSWKTILEEHGAVDEIDLLVVIARQPRDIPDLALQYTEELKDISTLPSNLHPPEPSMRWSNKSLNYHPEPPSLTELFDLA